MHTQTAPAGAQGGNREQSRLSAFAHLPAPLIPQMPALTALPAG